MDAYRAQVDAATPNSGFRDGLAVQVERHTNFVDRVLLQAFEFGAAEIGETPNGVLVAIYDVLKGEAEVAQQVPGADEISCR